MSAREARQPVAWWGLVSSAAAPVFLIGGWRVAAVYQPCCFDSKVDTISALAAYGAAERWIMTTALVGLGLCHLTTALALRDAAPVGRAILAGGGVATVLVAVFPLPADESGSIAHTVVAGSAFLALAVWPAVAWRRGAPVLSGRGAPVPLRPVASVAAAAALVGLVAWFGSELSADSGRVGLAERVAAGAQSLWPLAAAWGSHRWRR